MLVSIILNNGSADDIVFIRSHASFCVYVYDKSH